MAEFLRHHGSLNVVYLPAERRLLPPSQTGIDLNQLSEMMAWQKTAESHNAVSNYGRLDDQEFEQFAKALCISGSLPDDEGSPPGAPASRIEWPEFVETVDALISPKKLLPLTRRQSDQLRIATLAGGTHPVQDLSSGERQALIIISRVLRAGSGHTAVLIDEPDAYLHPHLSKRLVLALERGVGLEGQLVVATHSPAILDGMAPTAIVRMGHEGPPRLVADETERVELYRSAGFRASALTQSDLLLITEGESDVAILGLMFPELTRASVRSAGSKARVFREVEQLAPYELPVLGTVDRDVKDDPAPGGIAAYITIWPTADIEGVFLSDDTALQSMLDLGLIKGEFASVDELRALLTDLRDNLKENVLAEIAQDNLREAANAQWPTPKGELALDRLRTAAQGMRPLSADQVDDAIEEAKVMWDSRDRWTLVRGKYVLNAFAHEASEMKTGRALLEAVARGRPALAGFDAFRTRLTDALGSAVHS